MKVVARHFPAFAALFLAAALSGCKTAGKETTTGSPEQAAVEAGQTQRAETSAAAEAEAEKTAGSWPKELSAWTKLFDGKSLEGWKIVEDGEFSEHGKVSTADSALLLDAGMPFTGIACTGKVPADNYEVELSAMRRDGMDIFCGIFFPVGDTSLTMVLGGWNDTVVGLSCVNGTPAAYNETARFMKFSNDRWYAVRLRVTPKKIEGWVDDRQLVDFEREGRKLSPYPGLECLAPFGFFTWNTAASLRDIRIRALPPQ